MTNLFKKCKKNDDCVHLCALSVVQPRKTTPRIFKNFQYIIRSLKQSQPRICFNKFRHS